MTTTRPDQRGTSTIVGKRESAADVLMSASRVLVAVAARSLAQAEDQVTLAQYRALVVLATHGPLRPVDLAEAVGVDPSTATRMCDRLVRKKLILRSHRRTDRREVALTLSAGGRALVDEVTSRRRREFQRILAKIPAASREQLVESLRLFNEAACEASEGEWPLGLTS